jgi:hypothetical protein
MGGHVVAAPWMLHDALDGDPQRRVGLQHPRDQVRRRVRHLTHRDSKFPTRWPRRFHRSVLAVVQKL